MPIRPANPPGTPVRHREPSQASAPETPVADNNFEVGYGRPPVKTQFRKGESGNPKGRPKGARGLGTILDRTLNAPITIQANGRTTRASRLEVIIMRMTEQALKGDQRAQERLIRLYLENVPNPGGDLPGALFGGGHSWNPFLK